MKDAKIDCRWEISTIVQHIKSLHSHFDLCSIEWIRREANRVVDFLAKVVWGGNWPHNLFCNPPAPVSNWIMEDQCSLIG